MSLIEIGDKVTITNRFSQERNRRERAKYMRLKRYKRWRQEMISSPVTKRERQVWRLVAQGLTAKQIAKVLEITSATVDVHREHLLLKLKVHTAAALAAAWYKQKKGK